MAMTLIKPEDLISNEDYKRRREDRVKKIIEIKNRRRLEVGPWISLVFENRDTVIHQIQEMLFIENLRSPAEIAHEIETYCELLPGPEELSATFFIEIDDAPRRQKTLVDRAGIEKSLRLRLGEKVCAAQDKRPIAPEFLRPQASAVYYLRFPLGGGLRENLLKHREGRLEITHPAYRRAAALNCELIEELAREVV